MLALFKVIYRIAFNEILYQVCRIDHTIICTENDVNHLACERQNDKRVFHSRPLLPIVENIFRDDNPTQATNLSNVRVDDIIIDSMRLAGQQLIENDAIKLSYPCQ